MTARRPLRPLRLIDLDNIPLSEWPISVDAAYSYRGGLWLRENTGCVCCCELEGPEHVTLCRIDDENGAEHFLCMTHGELVEVPFTMNKVYTIKIGDVLREGEESLDDTMLFPAEMTLGERNALVERLLDEAAVAEHEAGPAPSD